MDFSVEFCPGFRVESVLKSLVWICINGGLHPHKNYEKGKMRIICAYIEGKIGGSRLISPSSVTFSSYANKYFFPPTFF